MNARVFRRWEPDPECSDSELAVIQQRISALNNVWFAGLSAPLCPDLRNRGRKAGEELNVLNQKEDALKRAQKTLQRV